MAVKLNAVDWVNREKCPLCGSREHKLHIDFPDIPVVRCKSCRFMFSQRIMTQASLAAYYGEGFGSKRPKRGQIVNAPINADAIRHLIPKDGLQSVLDVGTGYGFLLKHLQVRDGVQGVGIELSRQEVSYGIEVLGVDIRNQRLGQADLQENSFDLVTCFEVIEHVPDPVEFMKELLRFVKPGGYILVMTDNFESAVARSLGPAFPKWIPHSHISHFGPKTLKKLFLDLGLEAVGERSFTPWELLAKRFFRRGNSSPADAFRLADVLDSEMDGSYRLFHLRRVVNRIWARAAASSTLDGALMYLVGRRAA